MNNHHKYSTPAMAMHWLMAASLFALLLLGFYMADMPLSPRKLQLYSWHKWAGITLFALLWLRLTWRLLKRPPALPSHMNRLEQFVAHAGHALLYLLMFAIPLSGWLMSSAMGFQTVLFGIWPIPDLLERNRELAGLLATLHGGLNLLLVLAVLGHVGAALKHHFIDKDNVLRRMLPGQHAS